MGVNAQVEVGDLVYVFDNVRLARSVDSDGMVCDYLSKWIEGYTLSIVLEKIVAGSSGMGHAFKVVIPSGEVGWVMNYDIVHVHL